MKICLAQLQSIKGDIQGNILKHISFIRQAAIQKGDIIVFPELSLTGYEPEIAKDLALTLEDQRLIPFQFLSDKHSITICIGAPTLHEEGICISMLIFQPQQSARVYSKKYIHEDEEPFFISGDNFPTLTIRDKKIAFAICYELSVEAHADTAFKHGADLYIASVAKSASGVSDASQRLAYLATTHQISTMMVNSVGPSSGFISAGESSIWNEDGEMQQRLSDKTEGMLFFES